MRFQGCHDFFVLKPQHQIGGNWCNFRLFRFCDDDDVSNVHGFLRRRKNSRFPSRPVIGDSREPKNSNPAVRAASVTLLIADCCNCVSRTIPPLPTCSRPTSNWGFTKARHSAPAFIMGGTRGSNMVREMNETSIVTKSTGSPT